MNNFKQKMSNLDEILIHKKEEIEAAKATTPLSELKNIINAKHSSAPKHQHKFLNALKNANSANPTKNTKIIAEIKKASPSQGLIRENFDPESVAKVYEKCGAAAISVLTIRYGFEGHIKYLQTVKNVVKIPVLRKDFITEEYQIYEACANNADAILLIAAILDQKQIKDFTDLASELLMDVLVEVHCEEELEKTLKSNPQIVGINNRNLKTFNVDTNTTVDIIKKIPNDRVIVSESGITERKDIVYLEEKGVNAFLIGTSLMKSNNIEKTFNMLLK